MKVRFKFSKTGNLCYIGHLDVMRFFQKVNRRAALPVKYSGGYSPHQLMSFATPLGTGLTSTAEYVDMEFEDTLPALPEVIARMNAVSVPDLQVTDAVYLPEKSKNAMSLLQAADYEISFREGYEPADLEGFYEKLFAFFAKESIPVTKKTKTGEKEVDLRAQVQIIERRGDSLFMRVDTGSESNLKPEFALSVFYESMGEEFNPLGIAVCRTELYGREDGALRRLIDYGSRTLNEVSNEED